MKIDRDPVKKRLRAGLTLAAILFVLLRPPVSLPAQEPGQIVISASEQYEYARMLMDDGRFSAAALELDRLAHFFPEHALAGRAKILAGVCRMEENLMEEARASFSEAAVWAREGPLASWAVLLIGESYYRQGLHDDAAGWFRHARESTGTGHVKDAADYRLGWTMLREGRWSDAAGLFGSIDPSSDFHPSSDEISARSTDGYGLPRKNPATAGTLAALIPGLGHAYVTRYRDAAVAFTLNGLFIWATVESFNRDHNVLGVILGLLELGWYTGNIYSAVNVAHKYNDRAREDFLGSLEDVFDASKLPPAPGGLSFSVSFRF